MLQGFGLGFLFVPLSTIAFATLAGRLPHPGRGAVQPDPQHRIEHRHFAGDLPAEAQHADRACRTGGACHAVQRRAARHGAGPHLGHGDYVGRIALNNEITGQAVIIAYTNDFKLMMVVALGALPLISLLKRAKAQPGETAVLE